MIEIIHTLSQVLRAAEVCLGVEAFVSGPGLQVPAREADVGRGESTERLQEVSVERVRE